MNNPVKTLSDHDQQAIQALINRLFYEYHHCIAQIVLFGSKARGDDTEDSDIDVLILMSNETGDQKMKVWGLGADVSLDYDVVFNLFPYTQERWAWMASIRHPLWRSITAEGIDLTPELLTT